MSDKKKKTGQTEEPKLSAATVKKITELATVAGIEAYRAEKEKERAAFKDKRFNNTKLLLRKYKGLEAYTSNAIYETSQMLDDGMEEILEAFGSDFAEVRQVKSIKKSVTITKVIMEHVRMMLECYRRKCEGSARPEIKRRWQVIYQMYLADETLTAQEIANLHHISLSMVYTVVDSACDDLSTLFFGLDLTSM